MDSVTPGKQNNNNDDDDDDNNNNNNNNKEEEEEEAKKTKTKMDYARLKCAYPPACGVNKTNEERHRKDGARKLHVAK